MKYRILYDFEMDCSEEDSKYLLMSFKNKIDLAIQEYDVSYAYEISKEKIEVKTDNNLH